MDDRPVRVARDLVLSLRPQIRPLDLESICESLGVVLYTHTFGGPVRGLAIEGHVVVLDPRLDKFERQWTFAHEVGHILMQRRELGASVAATELLADQFARELLLPCDWLEAAADLEDLRRQLQVPRWLLGAQLAIVGRAPALQRDHEEVICVKCGRTEHAPRCSCHIWRRRNIVERQALPDVRELRLERTSSRPPTPSGQLQMALGPTGVRW